MRLTPLDIKKQEFSRGMRGYDADEVQAFLSMMASQWEEMQAEQRRNDEKVRDLKAKMEHYERVEVALQEALQTARENAKQALDNAKQEAKLIVKKAMSEADDLSRSAVQQRDTLAHEIEGLLHRRNEMVARLRAFLNSEGEILARFEERTGLQVPAPVAPAAAVSDPIIRAKTPEPPVEPEEDPEPVAEIAPLAESVPEPEIEPEPEEVKEVAKAAPLIEAVEEAPAEVETLHVEALDEVLDAASEEDEPLPAQVLDEAEIASEEEVEMLADAPVEETFMPRDEAEEQPALQINIPEEAIESESFYREKEPLSFKFFEPNEEKEASSFYEDGLEEKEQFGPDAPPVQKSDREPASNDTWIVRPTSETGEIAGGLTASAEEIEKIRKILNDLE